MLEKLQPIKITKRSCWLIAFLTKSKSNVKTENVQLINIKDADIIGADIIIFVFCFSIIRESVSLKY